MHRRIVDALPAHALSVRLATTPVKPSERLTKLAQASAYDSPYTASHRLKFALWQIVFATLFRPSPKFLSRWRAWLLRAFGAKLDGVPFIASSAFVRYPWNLQMRDRACLGEKVEVYNLGLITLGERCTVAQNVYLCAGTHDLSDPNLPLMTGPIEIGADCFIGVNALILPGVVIGRGAVVGGGAVVTRDVAEWTVVAGNPAREIGRREMKTATAPL